MLVWFWIISLLAFSTVGAARTRAATLDRYAIFIYICAVWWASIPIATGDWLWSLLLLPIGIVVARLIIRRRAASRATPTAAPPGI